MALRSFQQDPDYDEEDEFGYGWFEDESGQRVYGYDPIEARRLIDTSPATPPPPISQPAQPTAQVSDPSDYTAELSGQGFAGQPQIQDPNRAVPDVQPRPITPEAVRERAGTDQLVVDIPEDSRIAFVHNNPGNLMFAGQQGATRGEPKKGGGHWAQFATPEAGYQALHRQIALDAERGLSLGEFVSKYAPEFENNTAAYLRNVEGFSGATADTPLSGIDREALARAMARQESSTRIRGGAPPESTGGAPTAALAAMGQPAQLGSGMQPVQTTVRGTPLSPEQLQGERERIAAQTANAVAMNAMAANARIEGRQEAAQMTQQFHDDFVRDKRAQAQHLQASAAQAQQKVDALFRQPTATVEPLKVIKDMSGGDMVLGALAMIASSVGVALQHAGGDRTAVNLAQRALDQMIQQSIDSQKDAIARGEAQKKNRVAHWTKVMNDDLDGAKLAEAEAYQASGRRMEYLASTEVANADIQAGMMQEAQQLIAKGEERAAEVTQREADRIATTFAPPKPPPPAALGPVPVSTQADGQRQDPLEQSPELRQRALQSAEWVALPEAQKAKVLQDFSADMGNVEEMQRARDRLRGLYDVQPDAQGRYPQDADYGSAATGPWWNVTDAAPFTTKRDRALEKAWGIVRLAERMSWKTEPNNKAAQDLFQDLNAPARDTDVPGVLEQLDRKIEELERRIKAGTMPAARAYYYSQNVPEPDVRYVRGQVP